MNTCFEGRSYRIKGTPWHAVMIPFAERTLRSGNPVITTRRDNGGVESRSEIGEQLFVQVENTVVTVVNRIAAD